MDNYISAFELSYVIIGMQFNVVFEEGYFEEKEQNEILDFIKQMSKEMHIDSSYVDKKGTKFKSTFMLEEGWQSLNDVIFDSKCCKYLHPSSQETIADAFCMMGKCYMYECLALKYDFPHIQLEVDPKCKFEVAFLKDTTNAWKQYKGKWQTWKDDVWKGKSK